MQLLHVHKIFCLMLLVTTAGWNFAHAQEGPDNGAGYPSISQDGRFVAFWTRARNFIEFEGSDTSTFNNVFFFDRETRRIFNAQTNPSSESESYYGGATKPRISRDGGWVVFQSSNDFIDGNDGVNIFVSAVRSRANSLAGASKFKMISRAANGDAGNGISKLPTISYDGRFIAFISNATNLTDIEVNGTDYHLYRHDRDFDENGIFDEDEPGATQTIIIGNGAVPAKNNDPQFPTISESGGQILFWTQSGAKFWNNGGISETIASPGGLSPDGSLTVTTSRVYPAGNSTDLGTYYRYRSGGTETFGFPDNAEGSVPSTGAQQILTISRGQISGTDTNEHYDVYLINRATLQTTLISSGIGGAGNDVSGYTFTHNHLDMTSDANFILFGTTATNMGFADNNGSLLDIIIIDRSAGTRDRVEKDVTPPNWPTLDLQASNVTANSATLTWGPADDQGGIFSYTIREVGEDTPLSGGSVMDTITNIESLLPNTLYHLEVVANDPSGNSTVGGSVQFTTLPGLNPTLTLDVSVTGSGSVQSSPAGINCPGDCSEDYTEGTVVTLSQTADPGFAFDGWSGDCSGIGACQVTMDQARLVSAAFVAANVTYEVNVEIVGNGIGMVTSLPTGINCPGSCIDSFEDGTAVTLTPIAGGTSEFLGWRADCSFAGTAACQVTADQPYRAIAIFGDGDLMFLGGFE